MRLFPMLVSGAALFVGLSGGVAYAQLPEGAPGPPEAVQMVPAAPSPRAGEIQLSLTITVARYQGDKKVSSVPNVLSVVANSGLRASVRMGSQVPVATRMGDGPVAAYSYKDVGLNIDAVGRSSGDNRFRLDLTIADSSVAEDTTGKAGAQPVFRSFLANESILLRDGQTIEFTAATDKLTGEVTKITAALVVLK